MNKYMLKRMIILSLMIPLLLSGCESDNEESVSTERYSAEAREALKKHLLEGPEIQEKNDVTTEIKPVSQKYVEVIRKYDLVAGENDLAQYGTGDYFPLGDLFFYSEVADGIAGHSSLPLKQRIMSMNVATLGTGNILCTYFPVLSSYYQGKNDLFSRVDNSKIPAKLVHTFISIDHFSQIDYELKTTLSTTGVSQIKGAFDFSSSSTIKKTMILVKLEQDAVTLACDYAPLEDVVDFKKISEDTIDYISSKSEQDPLVYLSEIILGRRAILAIESDHSTEQVTSSLSAAFTSASASALKVVMGW